VTEFSVSKQIQGVDITMSAGKLAQLADGAVVVTIGDTQVLTTATAKRTMRDGADFFPLTVDVEERMYAVGRIPGSFFRREGRATERATLTCRLLDRPLRPSFIDGFLNETHIVTTVLSADLQNPYDVAALNAASAALTTSPIPFLGPIGGVRLALRDGEWSAFPTYDDLEESVFDLVVAGKRNAAGDVDIAMVEAGATEHGYRNYKAGQVPSNEETITEGLEVAKKVIGELIDLQLELKAQMPASEEIEWPVAIDYSPEMFAKVEAAAKSKLEAMGVVADKHERQNQESSIRDEVLESLNLEEDEIREAKKAFGKVQKNVMRSRVVAEGIRMDGRGLTDVRKITVEVDLLKEAHGSALFTRGETQVLNATTLGMLKMEQMLDTIDPYETKRYMHHYNFPPFSTGETGFMRGPKRREIGHGALAEKALLPVIPDIEEFPYAYRLVSEVLMSNGSSSMASVCGSSLSLMDAGVPIHAPVAGIAMGLIEQDGEFVTLTDILGAEDHLGDMDFKVAGSEDMITALQLDTKIESLPSEVLAKAMMQAREARLFILGKMAEVLPGPREELAENAPKIEAIQIPKDRIGEVIGPKGKNIRQLEEDTGATIEIEDDGTIRVGASSTASMQMAKERILAIGFPPEPELNKDYDGEVVNVTKFGAFVNIMPGRDGLLHISKMGGGRRIAQVEDVLALGDSVKVVIREIDDRGKVSLELADGVELELKPGASAPTERNDRGGRDRDDRGGRGRGGDRDRGGRDNGGSRGDRDRGGRDSGGSRGDRGRGGDRDRGGRDNGGSRGDRDRGGDRYSGGRDGGDRDRGGRDSGGSRNDRDGGNTGGQRRTVSFEDDFEGGN
jgi:polyribonucleotide nucleotidyltransferase